MSWIFPILILLGLPLAIADDGRGVVVPFPTKKIGCSSILDSTTQELVNALDEVNNAYSNSPSQHFVSQAIDVRVLDYTMPFFVHPDFVKSNFQNRIFSKLAQDTSFGWKEALQQVKAGDHWWINGSGHEHLFLVDGWTMDDVSSWIPKLAAVHLTSTMAVNDVVKTLNVYNKSFYHFVPTSPTEGVREVRPSESARQLVPMTFSNWHADSPTLPNLLEQARGQITLLSDYAGDVTTRFDLGTVLSNYYEMLAHGGVAFIRIPFKTINRSDSESYFYNRFYRRTTRGSVEITPDRFFASLPGFTLVNGFSQEANYVSNYSSALASVVAAVQKPAAGRIIYFTAILRKSATPASNVNIRSAIVDSPIGIVRSLELSPAVVRGSL